MQIVSKWAPLKACCWLNKYRLTRDACGLLYEPPGKQRVAYAAPVFFVVILFFVAMAFSRSASLASSCSSVALS